MRKVFAATVVGLVAAFGFALFPLSASAAVTPVWEACATSDVSSLPPNAGDCDASQVSVSGSTVTFEGTAGANIEALNLDLTLESGDTLSFDYTGPCGGGAPRVYVTIGETIYHTGNASEPCGVDGHVTYDLPTGGALEGGPVSGWDVAAAGVVVDAPAGQVVISNVMLGDNVVNFEATTGESESPSPSPSQSSESPSPSPSQTSESPSPSPSQSTASPSPSQSTNDPGTGGGVVTPTPTPSESSVVAAPPMNNSGSELPVTGSSKSTMLYLLGGGLMLVAIGGGAVLYARRNRDEVEFTS